MKQATIIDAKIKAGLDTYVIALGALMRAHIMATAPVLGEDYRRVKCEIRQKYARIVAGTSVYSYVDLATGDILKGNSKGPERAVMHIKRGNVLDGSWLDWHGPYGLGYANQHGEFKRMLDAADYMVAIDAIQANSNQGAADMLTAAITERCAARSTEVAA